MATMSRSPLPLPLTMAPLHASMPLHRLVDCCHCCCRCITSLLFPIMIPTELEATRRYFQWWTSSIHVVEGTYKRASPWRSCRRRGGPSSAMVHVVAALIENSFLFLDPHLHSKSYSKTVLVRPQNLEDDHQANLTIITSPKFVLVNVVYHVLMQLPPKHETGGQGDC
jgi:hypothetical protein